MVAPRLPPRGNERGALEARSLEHPRREGELPVCVRDRHSDPPSPVVECQNGSSSDICLERYDEIHQAQLHRLADLINDLKTSQQPEIPPVRFQQLA